MESSQTKNLLWDRVANWSTDARKLTDRQTIALMEFWAKRGK